MPDPGPPGEQLSPAWTSLDPAESTLEDKGWKEQPNQREGEPWRALRGGGNEPFYSSCLQKQSEFYIRSPCHFWIFKYFFSNKEDAISAF